MCTLEPPSGATHSPRPRRSTLPIGVQGSRRRRESPDRSLTPALTPSSSQDGGKQGGKQGGIDLEGRAARLFDAVLPDVW